MANYKRKRCRKNATGNRPDNMSSWPKWWDLTFHTRPKRAANRRLERAVVKGKDPDNIAWPLGNHKPHKYYW